MAKGINYGSIRRLNWVEPKFEEKVTKSVPHEEAGNVAKTMGAPITRGGHTALSPAIKYDKGPELYLGKAILQPMKYGPGGMQWERKRDSTGKFAPAQSAGKQSTAEEDQIDQQRDARLRQHRMSDRLHGEGNPNMGQMNAKKGMIPGMGGADVPNSDVNDSSSQVIGSTSSGQPVYSDPFHSAHQQFSDQDHQEAANLHGQMAEQSQAGGDMAEAAQHQSSAQAHMQQAHNSMSPGGRFMDNLFGQQGAPEVQPADMSQFSDLLGMSAQDQGMSNPAIAGNGPEAMMGVAQDPMSQDPMMGGPQDPSMAPASPSPMAQDPGMEQTGQQMPPQQDSLSSFLGQDNMEPGTDQNKPMAATPEPGPKPGMIDTTTGGPVGPQTDVGQSAAQPAAYDLDELFGAGSFMDDPTYDEPGMEGDMGDSEAGDEALPMEGGGDAAAPPQGIEAASDGGQEGPPPDGGEASASPSEDKPKDVPDSNAGAPGPSAGDSEDDYAKRMNKAISALRRYM